jgi:uncharacterized YigZ family protein
MLAGELHWQCTTSTNEWEYLFVSDSERMVAVERDYLVVRAQGRAEIVVKRSRFIATARPVDTESEAQQFIDAVRREFWDATHNVYAFTVGPNDEVVRSSDDGEPSGTAGRPVLEVILKERVKYCAVVVTRYFGGTLLGAGGLVRAYSSAARDGLHAAGIARVMPVRRVSFALDYAVLGMVQNYVAGQGYTVADIDYAERVTMHVLVPARSIEAFHAALTDLLHGHYSPETGEDTLALVDP